MVSLELLQLRNCNVWQLFSRGGKSGIEEAPILSEERHCLSVSSLQGTPLTSCMASLLPSKSTEGEFRDKKANSTVS